MKKLWNASNWAGASVLAAVAASLCCITPVLALLAGVGGMAASFSWIEPVRPYLVGLSVAALGLAWYQQLNPKQAEMDCACEPEGKPSFWQGKTFLGIVTLFAALMLTFPQYAQVFYSSGNDQQLERQNIADTQTLALQIEGMTCAGCEGHVLTAVNALPGILETNVSYDQGRAVVRFDKAKTSSAAITAAVDATGYRVAKSSLIPE